MSFVLFYYLFIILYFRIHCINVLKSLFSNSALAEGVLAYIESTFRLCFLGCASTHWSIRNAHYQLFAALIHRVFGIPKNAQRTIHIQNHLKMSSFTFFSRFYFIF